MSTQPSMADTELLLSLVARLGRQGEESQEEVIRTQLDNKIREFIDIFQHMEERVAAMEKILDERKTGDDITSELFKKDPLTAELNIRLELEHDRRVRAQEAIGEIEKERIVLKQKLDVRNNDYEQKTQEFDEVKLGCDYKVAKMATEMKKMETKLASVTAERDKRIQDLQSHNNELFTKLEIFEERYNNQLDVSRTLQNELQASYVETQSLIKEMEMLNLMFAELEHHIYTQQTKGTGEIEITANGKVVKVNEVLAAAQSAEPSQALLQESCFNEVTTRHGTKMVLSVSKTFLKLKDLILEKNTLQEQVTKMKSINEHLCSQVNIHEEKLCGITDELNNTWFYVSKIKEQHKKLHSAEQILRAELAEKRQILKGLRKELEESRASWNMVKAKTAESEKQWSKLKEDFAERKRLTRMLMSSSESGISDMETPAPEDNTVVRDTTVKTSLEGEDEDDEDDISEEIPDPFSDDEDDTDILNNNFLQPLVLDTGITSMVNVEIEEEEDEDGDGDGDILTPIFVPSMSYLAQVPTELQTSMFGSGKGARSGYPDGDRPDRERLEDTALEEVDDNVRDLITRLSSSTARGAFLANRLADIHRRIATGASLTDHNEWFEPAEDEETDVEPRETEYESDLTAASPSLVSEVDVDEMETEEKEAKIEDTSEEYFTASSSLPDTLSTLESGRSDPEDSRTSSPDSMVLAIDEAINILDPPRLMQSTFSLVHGIPAPPVTQDTNIPFLHSESVDDSEEGDSAVSGRERVGEALHGEDGSAAVTRFLIKHLPKQLTQLREEKHQLEDKIHDLELVVSEQRNAMAEHERRVEEAVSASRKMEQRLKKDEEERLRREEEEKETARLMEERREEGGSTLLTTLRVPVDVTEEETLLCWTVDCKQERPCCFWLNFIPLGGEECDSVILPCRAQDTTPLSPHGLRSCLQVECGHRGRYTLHIEGCGPRLPQVTVHLTPLATPSEQ